MRAVRSAIVWAIVLALTVLFGVPAIFAALVPPRGDWFLRFARGWARSVLAVAGIPVRVLHGDRIEVSGRSIRERDAVTRAARDEIESLRAEAGRAVA